MKQLKCLFIQQCASDLGRRLLDELRGADGRIALVRSPHEALARMVRSREGFDALFVGVDYFGKEDYRLFTWVKRQWPDVAVVTYASEGFRHKCTVAEMLGADARCNKLEDLEALDLEVIRAQAVLHAVCALTPVSAKVDETPAAAEPDAEPDDIVTPEELEALLEEDSAEM